MKRSCILGVDVAKAKVDVHLVSRTERRQSSFANTPEGMTELRAWLGRILGADLKVGIEATGCYWMAVAQELYSAGAEVCLLNPAYVKAHGQAQGRRSK